MNMKSNISPADAAKINRFHDWCRAFEQVFPCLGRLNDHDRIAIAQLLFDSLSQKATDPSAVYSLLQLLRQSDTISVEGGYIHSIGKAPGGGGPIPVHPKALSKAYLDGFDFLSSLHYREHLEHNPFHANKQLYDLLVSSPILSNMVAIRPTKRSDPQWYGGSYGRGIDLHIDLYVYLFHILSLSRSHACLSIHITFDHLSSDIHSPFIKVAVTQKLKQATLQDFCGIVKKCVKQFDSTRIDARNYISHLHSTEQIIRYVAGCVQHFVNVLCAAIDQSSWHRTPRPRKGIGYGHEGKDRQLWENEDFDIL